MPDNSVVIYVGSDSQPLTDQIKIGGRPLDLTSATSLNFKMREAKNDTLKVNQTADIASAPDGQVSYDWTDTDLDTGGEFYGWWQAIFPDGEIDTNEFLIIVREHSPGTRTPTGPIYRNAMGIIPITWGALENDDNYGDSLLQETIERAKLAIFGSTVLVDDEIDYDIRVLDYIAKLSVVQVIPAGVDYWLAQPQTVTTQGTQEMVSYPDRVAALWKIHERLTIDLANDQAIIEEILGTNILVPLVNTPGFSPGIDEGFKTPLPGTHFRDYAFPQADSWWY